MVHINDLEEIQNLLDDLDNSKEKIKLVEDFTPLYKQTILAFGISLSTMGAGFAAGFPAILFPQLSEHNDLNFELTTATKAMIASAPLVTVILGSLITGFLAHVFGKKYVLCAAITVSFIGWILLSLAYSFAVLIISRLVIGFGYGQLLSNAAVFISEMSSPKLRAYFLLCNSLFWMIAVLLVHTVGVFFTWRLVSACYSIVSLVGLFVLLFYPESPSWLISKGKFDLGIKSYYFIRGNKNSKELKQILFNHRENMLNSKDKFNYDIIKLPEIWKPFSIMLFYLITGEFSGYFTSIVYAVDIMKSSLGHTINEYLAAIIINLVRISSSLIAILLLKYLKIRTLAILSGILTTSTLGLLSVSLYLVRLTYNIPSITILGLLILYIFSVHLGISTLPWMMVAEVFPAKYRNILKCLCDSSANVMLFVLIHAAPYMFESLGLHGTFLVYFIITLVSTLFVAFFLPETKGKTLTEIEMSFKK